MIYVVGSGPAGVGCAHALLSRGVPVTMLDAGIELEPDLQQVVTDLRARPPDEWSAASLERIRRPTEGSRRTFPLKAAYGSLFPYRDASHLPIDARAIDALPSFAKGGLSNVWGGTMLPYHARDVSDWPIGMEALAPHYAAAARLMGVSGVKDRLEAEYPLFTDGLQSLRPSHQADALMKDLTSNAAVLEAAGWLFGYSRLAVAASPNETGQACVYCGLCMYGCPYGVIYNSGSTLDRLRRHDSFRYRPGVVVTRVVESAGGVRVHGVERTTGEPLTFDGDRVCLAANTFATTAILLASLEAYDTPVRVSDSQCFLLPVLRYRGTDRVRDEPLHTLSQIFIELLDPAVSHRNIHLQVFTYNDWFLDAVKRRIGGALYRLSKPLLDAFLGRLLIVQGYLHSDLSPHLSATLRRGETGNTLVLDRHENVAARPAIERVVKVLARHRHHLAAVPLSPGLEICGPGRSYHTGGSFPMRSRPTRFESDRWGRPYGFERVHAVDSTVLPSVPAGPITFTVVANAHRIASELEGGARSG